MGILIYGGIMAHVVVGERLAGMNPEMIGHVIRGAGHFLEAAGGVFQTGAPHMPAIPIIAQGAINDLSTPVAAERWQWQRLGNQYGEGSLLAGSNHESSAWRDFMDHPSMRNNIDSLKDAGLSIGSFLSGDMENGIGYGVSAFQKSIDGTLRDWGFNGGWGEGYGSPFGTWQPTGAGRDH
jgi:hypothetical protein